MVVEKTKYEKSDAILVVTNMATKKYQTLASAIRASSDKALSQNEIYNRIVSDTLAELQSKADAKKDRDFLFNKKIEAGIEVPAPDTLVDAIKADHAKVRYARSIGDNDTMYKDYSAYKLARAWKYEGFTHGRCYAKKSTIETLCAVYGIEA